MVQKQLELLKWRNRFEAFGFDAEMEFECPEPHRVHILWRNRGCTACLGADLRTAEFSITAQDESGNSCFAMKQ